MKIPHLPHLPSIRVVSSAPVAGLAALVLVAGAVVLSAPSAPSAPSATHGATLRQRAASAASATVTLSPAASATSSAKHAAAQVSNTPAPTPTDTPTAPPAATATATPPPSPTPTPSAPTWHVIGSYSGAAGDPPVTLATVQNVIGPIHVNWTCQMGTNGPPQTGPEVSFSFTPTTGGGGVGGGVLCEPQNCSSQGLMCNGNTMSGLFALDPAGSPPIGRDWTVAANGSQSPHAAYTATIEVWY